MIILTEQLEAENLVEVDGKKKRHYIHGVFIQSNIKNRNGRIYPKDIVQREVARYDREMIQKNRAVGELNHPNGSPEINYERACIKINELREDGNNWIGKALVRNPYGQNRRWSDGRWCSDGSLFSCYWIG